MALSQSVVSELLEAFRAGEGVDLIRESVRLVMQELIETEATERRRRPLRAHRDTGHGPQRVAAEAGSDPGWRCGATDPEAAEGFVLPGVLRPTSVRDGGGLAQEALPGSFRPTFSSVSVWRDSNDGL